MPTHLDNSFGTSLENVCRTAYMTFLFRLKQLPTSRSFEPHPVHCCTFAYPARSLVFCRAQMFAKTLVQRSSTWSYHSLPRRPLSLTHSSLAAGPRLCRQQYPRSMATADGAAALNQKDVKQEAQHLANGNVPVNNNWSSPGPAAYDFRSMYPHILTTRATDAQANPLYHQAMS